MRASRAHALCLGVLFVALSTPLSAQHRMAGMAMHDGIMEVPDARRGSGTSWLPDSSTLRAHVSTVGAWRLMLQASAFGQFSKQNTKRGDRKFGVVDWEMLMAMRDVRGGMLHLRLMTSAEPLLLGESGYPLLLQTGGTYQHAFIHDRQHPHAALVELGTLYEHALTARTAVSLYAAAVGEPALGPPAFMHRPSAANDPMAPLGHHWQDAAHQSFGVATVGINTRTLKLEGSAFNPREADEHHPVIDYRGARLDSYAGRVSWAPSPKIVASSWWGFLNAPHRLDPTSRMHRYGASVLTQMNGPGAIRVSSAIVWGMNLHHHGGASHAVIHGSPGASPHHHASSFLAESNLEIGRRNNVFARIERVRKNGEELGFLGGDLTTLYDVRSIVLGGTREMLTGGSLSVAVGARGALNFVPASLLPTYGTRTPTGFSVYTQLRPARMK